MLNTHLLDHGFQARIGSAVPDLDLATRNAITRIWNAEKAKRGDKLFNGQIFSVDKWAGGAAIGFLTEYKWFVAQRRQPALYEQLKVRPLAVSGFVICEGSVLLGRRSSDVEQIPGAWELAPSGIVDGNAIRADGHVDLESCFLCELHEEIGLTPEDLEGPLSPFLVIEDTESKAIDIVVRAHVRLDSARVREAFSKRKTREYVDLAIMPASNIHLDRERIVTPMTGAVLQAAKASL